MAQGVSTESDIRKYVEGFFDNELVRNPSLDVLVKANWTSVISLCSDDHARQKLKEFIYLKPTHWSVDTVAAPNESLSQTTIPYYAMLGDIRDKRETHRLAVSRSQYLKRKRSWATMLQTLPDVVKSDPIIFIGTENIVEKVCDFMNELFHLAPKIPKRLIFLQDDHTITNPVFKNLVADLCSIHVVPCTIRELSDLLSKDSLSLSKLPLFAEASQKTIDFKVLSETEDQVAYVPRREELVVNPTNAIDFSMHYFDQRI